MTAALTTPKRTASWVTLGLLAALLAYLAFRIAGPYLEALLVGALLATLFYPLHLMLLRKLGNPRTSAVVSTVLVTVTVILPIALAITTLVRQLSQGAGMQESLDRLWPAIDGFAARLGFVPGQLQAMAQERLRDAESVLVRGVATAATATTGGVLQLIVAIGAFHFSLSNGEWLHEQVLLHSPLGRQRTATLLDTVHQMIRASFYGVVAVGAVQGTLLGIAAWIAGLPIPVLWGVATMFVSVLPIIGSALVWVPGSILLLAQGEIGMGIFFLVWCALLVTNADNFVRPMIMMAALPVNGLLVFIAILGGMQAFGLIGLFVGPVTLALGVALLKMLREEVQAVEAGLITDLGE